MPPSLASLPRMRAVDLSSNRLGGNLPQEWGASGRWPVLTSLDLSGNSLGGNLPQEWGRDNGSMQALAQLDVSSNELTGSLPDWPSRCVREGACRA